MATKTEELTERMVMAAASVEARMRAEFERLKRDDPEEAFSRRFGFADPEGKLESNGEPHKGASMKYVVRPRAFIERFYRYTPFFLGLNSVYEIGVGPGYLFLMLKELMGVDMCGCDVDIEGQAVYRELRNDLGIALQVHEFAVSPRRRIPIPKGTEALCAFYTVFNQHWKLEDHEWFLRECGRKLSGPKQVILNFNPQGFSNRPDIAAFYRERARFPLTDESNFCILDA